jgi:hypothetical protein
MTRVLASIGRPAVPADEAAEDLLALDPGGDIDGVTRLAQRGPAAGPDADGGRDSAARRRATGRHGSASPPGKGRPGALQVHPGTPQVRNGLRGLERIGETALACSFQGGATSESVEEVAANSMRHRAA